MMSLTLTEAPVLFPADWAERANCRDLGIQHFFEDLRVERRGDPYAKARHRDVRLACLASSINEGLRTGFFAGSIPARRLEIRKAAQQDGVDVTSSAELYRYLHRTTV
jgi:hypothetical protein